MNAARWLPAIYAHCAAFIVTAFCERLPTVVRDTWAYGKPVLMTLECNLPEGFAANAVLRIGPNAKSIVEWVREGIQVSSSKLDALADNGLQLVTEKFAWSKLPTR